MSQKTDTLNSGALHDQKCAVCEGGVPLLSPQETVALGRTLDKGWRVVDDHHLFCRYAFDDFASALDFAVRVGAVAEAEGHHPDITVGWGKAEIVLFTHAVDGLTRNDFILAAKIDRLTTA